MTRRLDDLPRFPLRDHGSSERVERIWRRLSPELAATPVWARPQTWWAPAALVAVFGAGVFVGARFVHADSSPLASAERPVAVEAAQGQPTPRPVPAQAPNPRARVVPVHRRGASGLTSPVAPLPTAKQAAPIASVVPVAAEPSWEKLAAAGDFEAARKELELAGGFDSVLGSASASQLMTLVDIGRAAGRRDRAVAALRRVLEFFRDAPEAPLAAWTLGNLLDQSGDEGGASDAYALYRRLSPGGDFAEDALAREIDSALSQGHLELSARLIAQYENEFPNGRSLEEYRSELARRSERAIAPDAAPNEPGAGPEPARESAPAKPVHGDEPAVPIVRPSAK